MSLTVPSTRQLSRQMLLKVLMFGTAIVTVATIFSYYLVYSHSKDKTLGALRQYMLERKEQENQIFANAVSRLALFRDEFMALYLSDLDFTEQEFWDMYFVDQDGAVRMQERYFLERYDRYLGRSWGVTSFIGNNQPVDSHDLQRRLLLANILVNRYGPAWEEEGVLHASYPENAITIYYPKDPWGLKAEPDLPMNELGTIQATLQAYNPERKTVWTGLYYDETADVWTLTVEMPVDYQGRHLINPSMDVRLESIMKRLHAEHPAGAYNFIVNKQNELVAHPGRLNDELKRQGQLSLDELGNPDLSRMYRLITDAALHDGQDLIVVEDHQGGNYLVAATLEGPDWWFVLVYPQQLITRDARSTSNIVLFLGFFLFILYYLAVYFVISRKVSLPLNRMRQAVSLVAGGNYQQVIENPDLLPTDQKNEIGELAGSFLNMCREVSDVQSNLQSIVMNRTRELEDANSKLRDLSLLDGLTGIHNRRSFDRDIARVFAQAQAGVECFSLLMADVDFFKNYNDIYGHTAGDEVLRNVTQTIADSIRQGDRVYRYGGEEIAVIFNTVDPDSAELTGVRILEAVRELGIRHAGSPHGVITLSAGLVEYDPGFEAVTAMVHAADTGLYEAKSSGRNRLYVAPAAHACGAAPETPPEED